MKRTKEEIINAMEKRSHQTGMKFRYEKLDYLNEDGINFIKKLAAVRSRRAKEFYRSTTDQSYMQAIESAAEMIQSGIPEGQQTIDPIIEDIIQQFNSDENNEIQNIIRNINHQKELDQQIVDELSAKTSKVVSSGTVDDKFIKGISAAMSGDDYSEYVSSGKAPYKRISEYIKDGEFKKLFTENTTLRRSVYAAGALIAGSFIYSGIKDHTAENVKGPPLLPGGSAYEEQYPNRMAEIPQIGTTSYNPGVSYKVNLFGGKSMVDSFKQRAMGVGNFNMNTTMYSGIPDVTRNPLSEMANSF